MECNDYYDETLIDKETDFAPQEEEGEEKKADRVPPLELQMYWMSKTYESLPVAGGLMDQPYFFMICMNVCAESQSRAEEIKRRILETKRNATNYTA